MSPTAQTTQWLEQINTFLANLREAGPFIVLAFIVLATLLLVGLAQYLNYRLRSFEVKREEARKQDIEQTTTRQDETLSKIVNIFGDAVRESKEDIAASLTVFKLALDRQTNVQEQTNTILTGLTSAFKALDDHAAERRTMLQQHDARAETGIADILVAIGRVENKVDNALRGIAEIKAFYPNGESPLAKVERELAEAIEALRDCAKHATDEHPIVPLPVEAAPEDASALTPGSEAAA